MSTKTPTAVVFDIQRYTVHDGPGIRTEVFLKGCPLRCEWCCSPESQAPEPELMYIHRNCAGAECRNCIETCPESAISLTSEGDGINIDRNRCTNCGECIDVCYEIPPALEMSGERMTVSEVMEEIHADSQFYRKSSGGVTVSGGEALQRSDFVKSLLQKCKRNGYHTCVDTSGYVKWEDLEKVLPHLDLILFDIKHVDNKSHEVGTGVPNKRILDNFKRLLESDVDVIVRVPIIPGFNTSKQDLEDIAEFIADADGQILGVELQPYHSLGRSKYRMLDREYPMNEVDDLAEDSPEVKRAVSIFEDKGHRVALKSLGIEYTWDKIRQ